MNYTYFKTLDKREQVAYLVGLIKYWNSLGVNDEADIIRELKLNTNSDPFVTKVLNTIFNK